MRPDGYWLGLAGGVIVLVLSVELVRRRYVRGRLALAWVVLGVIAVVFSVLPSLLTWLTAALHVQVPLNLVLFSGVLFLLVISMQLAGEVGRLEARTRRLAEEVAILSSRLDDGHEAPPRATSEPGSPPAEDD
ncbi:DUF2304 domain-containing protein [Phycicoccus sp. CSK15P-2]|uniref:DUF2304 domain-containing protein n=1 Tax=Phycicoccus sp. CSK15P-2 TaxID=2807627 RepID=UPI0019507A2C|nr:DUF2304 domain-containing protein [Phycicoccus sp. CSK15P-2]MBM6405966.1 DUF2304 domain-containing protein [Phycicoccus sp. CSK15P-2]